MIKIKQFSELSLEELYEILKARVNVFVVEQNCPYPELDDLDQNAWHIWEENDGHVSAYCRILPAGVPFQDASAIGRMLSVDRGTGAGKRVLKAAIHFLDEVLKSERIRMQAQAYATGFYESEGFEVCSDPFDEDGIPHVEMVRSKNARKAR